MTLRSVPKILNKASNEIHELVLTLDSHVLNTEDVALDSRGPLVNAAIEALNIAHEKLRQAREGGAVAAILTYG